MTPSSRALLLERNLTDCVADRVLFVNWSADDIAHLELCGLNLSQACVASQGFEDFRTFAAMGDNIGEATFDLPPQTDHPFDLAIVDLPYDLSPMREMMQHHVSRTRDAGLTWLRQKILQFAKDS